MSYMDANSQVRREVYAAGAAAGATTAGSKVRVFQSAKLHGVHLQVVVAGTSSVHGYTIKNGTSSIGTITLGTNTAGYQLSATITGNTTIPAGGTMSILSLTDATGTVDAVFEFEVIPSAVKSA